MTLFFLTRDLILFGKVEPQFLFIFNPLGDVPISYTLAPKDLRSFGPDLYPAPFAQSIAILIPLSLKFFGKFFFKISKYISLASSSLLTLPKVSALDKFLIIF